MWDDVDLQMRDDVDLQMCDDVDLQMCDDVDLQMCDDVDLQMCDDVDLQMCDDVDLQMWDDVDLQMCDDVDLQMCDDVDLQMCDDVDLQMCDDVDLQMCDDVDLQMCDDVDMLMYYNGCFFLKNPSQMLSGKTEQPSRRSCFTRVRCRNISHSSELLCSKPSLVVLINSGSVAFLQDTYTITPELPLLKAPTFCILHGPCHVPRLVRVLGLDPLVVTRRHRYQAHIAGCLGWQRRKCEIELGGIDLLLVTLMDGSNGQVPKQHIDVAGHFFGDKEWAEPGLIRLQDQLFSGGVQCLNMSKATIQLATDMEEVWLVAAKALLVLALISITLRDLVCMGLIGRSVVGKAASDLGGVGSRPISDLFGARHGIWVFRGLRVVLAEGRIAGPDVIPHATHLWHLNVPTGTLQSKIQENKTTLKTIYSSHHSHHMTCCWQNQHVLKQHETRVRLLCRFAWASSWSTRCSWLSTLLFKASKVVTFAW